MMEGMYGHGYSDYSPPPQVLPENSPPVVEYEYEAFAIPATPTAVFRDKMVPIFGSDIFSASSSAASESCSIQQRTSTATAPAGGSSDQEIESAMIRAKISSHPSYPKLLQAYIDCQKVGAPPEIVDLLDETLREKDLCRASSVSSSCLGDDPELDEFMETYCDMLVKYKSDLARPFDEATTFLNKMESQLTNLCNGYVSDEAAESSEDDTSAGEIEVQESNRASEDRELKDKLLRRYGGYFSSLKHEFSKKKKKGKLPREARQTLFDWWSAHYKWPYPTEADKVALAESTGLDQKQINNWFINQRKRHWKPSENMQFAVMDSLYGSFLMND